MEKITKSFPIEITKTDTEQGIVEAIVSVMGNIDFGNDIIHNGAFSKTITERGNRIMILDYHRLESNRDIIGKAISLREIGSNELPENLKRQYPEATGGLHIVAQFDMDDENSKAIFNKLAKGYLSQWSIGFSIPKGKSDYQTITNNGETKVIRNIREVILYECSPVGLAMNDATTTVSAKDNNTDENEQKKRSIIQTYIDITDSFNAQYMNYDEYTGFMVNDVFTDGTLVCKAVNVQTDYDYYQVNWQIIDGDYAFDPIENWQGGNFSFVVGLKSFDIIEETKQGRVLSQSNYDKIKNACDMLMEVMNAAMPIADEIESMSDTPELEAPAESEADILAKSQEALTKKRDERLAEINQLIKNLDNLGVH